MSSKWSKWAQLAQVIAPAILATVPGVPIALIPVVTHVIQEAQEIPNATGAQKKDHVLNVVMDSVTAVNLSRGKEKPDPAAVKAAVSQGIDAAIGAINIVKDLHADVPK